MRNEIDIRLTTLLAFSEREADEKFVSHVRRLVLAEQRINDARRAAWNRFGFEAAATAAVLVVFYQLWSMGVPLSGDYVVPLFGTEWLGLLVIGCWLAVGLRPPESGSAAY